MSRIWAPDGGDHFLSIGKRQFGSVNIEFRLMIRRMTYDADYRHIGAYRVDGRVLEAARAPPPDPVDRWISPACSVRPTPIGKAGRGPATTRAESGPGRGCHSKALCCAGGLASKGPDDSRPANRCRIPRRQRHGLAQESGTPRRDSAVVAREAHRSRAIGIKTPRRLLRASVEQSVAIRHAARSRCRKGW